MPAKKKPRLLYAYPTQEALITSRALEQSLQQRGKALKDGGYVLELPDSAQRKSWRADLIDADVLCDFRPLGKSRQRLWQEYLVGEGKTAVFSPLPFLLGPLWYLWHGLMLKFVMLIAIFMGIQAAGVALAEYGIATLPELFSQVLEFGGIRIKLGWGPIEHLAVALYASLYAENDLFLRRIRGQHLWAHISGAGFGLLTVLLMICCIGGWTLTKVSMDRVVRQALGTGETFVAELEDPLWRVAMDMRKLGAGTVVDQPEAMYWDTALALFKRERLDDAQKIMRAQASTGDPVAQFHFGRLQLGVAAFHRERLNEEEAVIAMREALEALKAASLQEHMDAKRILYELTKDVKPSPNQ